MCVLEWSWKTLETEQYDVISIKQIKIYSLHKNIVSSKFPIISRQKESDILLRQVRKMVAIQSIGQTGVGVAQPSQAEYTIAEIYFLKTHEK